MKKRILITITIISITIISYFCLQIFIVEKEKNVLENAIYKGEFEFTERDLKQATKLKNGLWKNATNFLTGVEIANGKWTMLYKGEKIDSTDVYDFKIKTEYLKELSTQSQPIEFLTLTNKTDTIDYLILGSSERMISLSRISNGKNYVYIME